MSRKTSRSTHAGADEELLDHTAISKTFIVIALSLPLLMAFFFALLIFAL